VSGKASALLTPIQRFWAARNQSERRTLSVAGILLAAFAIYALIYEPLQKSQAQMRTQIKEQAQAIAAAKAAIAARGPLTKTVLIDDRSALSVVDQAVREANLQSGMKSIGPGDNGSIRVEFAGVNFAKLATVLEKLEDEQRFVVFELSIDAVTAGVVNAKISLKKKDNA
jgi:type II secretory pathway component PulM